MPFWIAAGLAAGRRCVATVDAADARDPYGCDAVLAAVAGRAGLPTIVGTVGAVLQYGVLAFLATYAVDEWGSRRPGGGHGARRRPDGLDRGQDRRWRQRRPHRRHARASVRTGVLLTRHRRGCGCSLPAGVAHVCHRRDLRRHRELDLPRRQRARRRALRRQRDGARRLPQRADRHRRAGGARSIGNSPTCRSAPTVLRRVLVPLSLLWFCRAGADRHELERDASTDADRGQTRPCAGRRRRVQTSPGVGDAHDLLGALAPPSGTW